MFRVALLATSLLLVPIAAMPVMAAGATAEQSRTGENCDQQSERRRQRGRGLGGIIGGRLGGAAGLVNNVLPVGELLGEAIASLLDCREQQQAAAATEEATRG